jgi:gamma-glutamyl:cysteine ligase YbdK (ATP-grasp superfamily)
MYDELVKRLRAYAGLEWHFRHISKQAYEMIKEAADAIEELEELSRRQEVELVKLTEELASKPRWIPVT